MLLNIKLVFTLLGDVLLKRIQKDLTLWELMCELITYDGPGVQIAILRKYRRQSTWW
jgi:hypothetical protein